MDRLMQLETVRNFRDYGGYRAAGGGRVRRGLLWRSGEHGEASEADLDRVAALDLRHIVDLRGNGEREASPCRRHPDFDGEVLFFDGDTGGLASEMDARDGTLSEAQAHEVMTAIYAALPERANLLSIMRRYFAALARGEGASLVHCHAGKDRTGMAVAFLHHALGVHPDDAMEDYLLTNTADDLDARVATSGDKVRARYGPMEDGAVRAFMGVDARYLHAARAAVRERYGSELVFLERALGVDAAALDALRLHLLED